MTKFYVLTNGLHTTVVNDDDVLDRLSMDVVGHEGHEKCALEAAISRFEAHRMDHAGLAVTAIVDTESDNEPWYGDDPSCIGLTDGVYLSKAAYHIDDDDVSVDCDSELSGYNVQTWTWLDPETVLDELAKEDSAPVLNARERAARGRLAQDRLQALGAKVTTLLAQLGDDVFVDTPEQGERVRLIRALVEELGADVSDIPKPNPIVHQAVIRTWEAGEGSAADMTELQRRPWKLRVESRADQLGIVLWPAAEAEEEATEGMNLILELNKGYPALHVGPGPMGDNLVHVHVLNEGTVEVTPDTGHLVVSSSEVYPETEAMVATLPRS